MSEVKMYKRMIVLNREIVRQGNKRYIIYLPTDLNDICEDADSNGICDKPYIVAVGNRDYYPLKLVTAANFTSTPVLPPTPTPTEALTPSPTPTLNPTEVLPSTPVLTPTQNTTLTPAPTAPPTPRPTLDYTTLLAGVGIVVAIVIALVLARKKLSP